MGGQVEQGISNVEVFFDFNILNSTLDIQYSIPLTSQAR
jgi:hypothetical protein